MDIEPKHEEEWLTLKSFNDIVSEGKNIDLNIDDTEYIIIPEKDVVVVIYYERMQLGIEKDIYTIDEFRQTFEGE